MNIKMKLAGILTAIACAVNATIVVPMSAYALETSESQENTETELPEETPDGVYGPLTYVPVDGDSDEVYDYIEIINCDSFAETVEIPAELEGLPVKGISSSAFQFCNVLTEIVVPENITYLEDRAFADCELLKNITIKNPECIIFDEVYTLSDTAVINGYVDSTAEAYALKYGRTFNDIENPTEPTTEFIVEGTYRDLTYVAVDEKADGVYDYIEIKACDIFAKTVSIPETINDLPVKTIGEGAFLNCDSMTAVTIPNTVTSIGASAFEGCSLLETITIPDSVTTIGAKAFAGCETIYTVAIPEGITLIDSGTFSGCTKLNKITVPSTLKNIKSDAFFNTALVDKHTGIKYADTWVIGCDDTVIVAEIDVDAKGIAECAFRHCYGLESVNMPEGLNIINESAFESCESLASVTVPSSVTYIGPNAFNGCIFLENITINNPECVIFDDAATISATAAINGYSASTAQKYAETYSRTFIDVEVPTEPVTEPPTEPTEPELETEGTYKALSYQLIDEDADGTFDYAEITGCEADALTVEIPADINGYTVKSIGDNAFQLCDVLTKVVIPDTVTRIGASAFEFCEVLRVISIPESVTSIGPWAFASCPKIPSVIIPEGVTVIDEGTFSECTGLRKVTIPESVKAIKADAFYNTGLLNAQEGPVYYADTWVIGCNQDATAADIAEGTRGIADYAFQQCYELKNVTIPEGVVYIGNCAFDYCDALVKVVVPESVVSLDDCAFSDCTSLRSITIKNPECVIFDSEYTITDTAKIYGYLNSTAQTYAEAYERTFADVEVSETIKGDVTGDEKVNLYDAIAICRHIMGAVKLEEDKMDAADYNSDTKVDLYDVIGIAKFMMG